MPASQDIKDDSEAIKKILQSFDEITKEPESFLSIQEEKVEKIQKLLKDLYSVTVESNNEHKDASVLSELVTDNMDEEQIWQQLEIRNNCAIEKLIEDTSKFLSQPDSKFIIDLNLSQDNNDEEESKTSEDENQHDYFDSDKGDSDLEDIDMETKGTQIEKKLENRKKTGKSSIVDDKFFKLSEMEEFLNAEDEKEMQRMKGNISKDDEEEQVDYFEDLSDEEDEDNLKYKDFFDPEEGIDDQQLKDLVDKAEEDDDEDDFKNEMLDEEENEILDEIEYEEEEGEEEENEMLDEVENEAKGEEEEENESDNDDDEQIEEEEGEEDDEENLESNRNDKTQRKKEKKVRFKVENKDSDSDDDQSSEKDETDAPKSSFELRQERLKERIEEREKLMLSEKPWQLKGEIQASNRPQNSLLEEVLEFDASVRPAPVITEETTLRLEDIIRRRIKDQAWDDVERKVRTIPTPQEFRKQLILNQEKSKESLAQIYEKEYQKELDKFNPDRNEHEEEPKEHKEIKTLMKDLFLKLDTLTNFHYTPKPVVAEPKIITNTPTIAMEEVAPISMSDGNLLAPEEVKKPAKSDVLGKSERDRTDKNRERRKKKLRQKHIHKAQEEKALEKQKLGLKLNEKEEKRNAFNKVIKNRNVRKMETSNDGKSLASSKSFFTQLQDKTTMKKTKIKRKAEQPGISAKKLKL